jgi:sigma-B regulation protein RsbU (phosphoserine phosphatase)
MAKNQLHAEKNTETDSFKKRINNVKLTSLLEITKAINSNLPTEGLFKLYENILVNELNIGKIALFTYNNDWKCVLKYGIANESEDIKIEIDLLKYKEITEVEVVSSDSSSFETFDIIIPVYHKSQPLAYLLIGDIDEQKIEISPTIKHLPFVQTLTNIIIVAIENKRLVRESLLQVASRKELELASEMQNMLFPDKLPDNNQLSIHAYYQPHHQVGGDYYDFIKLNDYEVVFCVADVSGKGVSAALLMANFQANLRALFKHSTSLTDIIHELNTLVFDNAKGEKFITIFLARYNLVTRMLTYINAGHNPPLMICSNTLLQLTTGGIGVGMLPEIPRIREGVVHVSPQTVLLCYTDGLIEQKNDEGEDFGMDRLIQIILQSDAPEMKKLNTSIILSLDKFKQDMSYVDDIALFSCRFL